MRLIELENPKIYKARKGIPLKLIHQWKIKERERLAAEKERAPLLVSMYGQPVDHEVAMNAVELKKSKVELDALKAEQGTDAYKAIKRLSRSAMRVRKE